MEASRIPSTVINQDVNNLANQLDHSVLDDNDDQFVLTTSPGQFSHPKWGPSLQLRAHFHKFNERFACDPDETIGSHNASEDQIQLALVRYLNDCFVSEFTVTVGGVPKKKSFVAPSGRGHCYSIKTILTGMPSPEELEWIDFDQWADILILALANISHSSKMFKKIPEAIAQIQARFMGTGSGDKSNGKFSSLSLFAVRLDQMLHQDPVYLRDWATNLGLVVRYKPIQPGEFLSDADRLNIFKQGPLIPEMLDAKVTMCVELHKRLKRFVDKDSPDPAALQSLLTAPEFFSTDDLRTFIRVFELPATDIESREDLVDCITALGHKLLKCFWFLNNDNPDVLGFPPVWKAAIFYHLVVYEMGNNLSADTFDSFRKAPPEIQALVICNAACECFRKECYDESSFDWQNATMHAWRAAAAVARCYNAFDTNVPDDSTLKAQVLSMKYHTALDEDKSAFLDALRQLGLPLLPFRKDFSLEFGPRDGEPVNAESTPALGPSSDQHRRLFLTCAEGMARVTRISTDRAPVVSPVFTPSPPSPTSPVHVTQEETLPQLTPLAARPRSNTATYQWPSPFSPRVTDLTTGTPVLTATATRQWTAPFSSQATELAPAFAPGRTANATNQRTGSFSPPPVSGLLPRESFRPPTTPHQWSSPFTHRGSSEPPIQAARPNPPAETTSKRSASSAWFEQGFNTPPGPPLRDCFSTFPVATPDSGQPMWGRHDQFIRGQHEAPPVTVMHQGASWLDVPLAPTTQLRTTHPAILTQPEDAAVTTTMRNGTSIIEYMDVVSPPR
eukprot:gene34418-42447_t